LTSVLLYDYILIDCSHLLVSFRDEGLVLSNIIPSLPALYVSAALTGKKDLRPAASIVELAAAGLALIPHIAGPILIGVRKGLVMAALAAARAAAVRHNFFPVTTGAGVPVSDKPVSGVKHHFGTRQSRQHAWHLPRRVMCWLCKFSLIAESHDLSGVFTGVRFADLGSPITGG
jgi:hypothetical protein